MNRTHHAAPAPRRERGYEEDEREMRENYDYAGYGAHRAEPVRDGTRRGRGLELDDYERARYAPGGRFEQNPWDVPRGERPYAHDLQNEPRSATRGASHSGRGPRGYVRSDARIHEDVCDRLYLDHELDASEIDVRVADGRVLLDGRVDTPRSRRRADDIAHAVPGVTDVFNHLQVASRRR